MVVVTVIQVLPLDTVIALAGMPEPTSQLLTEEMVLSVAANMSVT